MLNNISKSCLIIHGVDGVRKLTQYKNHTTYPYPIKKIVIIQHNADIATACTVADSPPPRQSSLRK